MLSQVLFHSVSFRSCNMLDLVNLQFKSTPSCREDSSLDRRAIHSFCLSSNYIQTIKQSVYMPRDSWDLKEKGRGMCWLQTLGLAGRTNFAHLGTTPRLPNQAKSDVIVWQFLEHEPGNSGPNQAMVWNTDHDFLGWGRPFCWTWGHVGHNGLALLTFNCAATNCINSIYIYIIFIYIFMMDHT